MLSKCLGLLLLPCTVEAFPVVQSRRRVTPRVSESPSWAMDSPTRLLAAAATTENAFHFERKQQSRDIVIVGGALAGLSAALYISQMDPTRHITILDREEYGKQGDMSTTTQHAQPASFAAAGMLAPFAERLPPGPLLDLCMSSRRMYTDFCDMVESLAQDSGEEGEQYLYPSEFPSDSGNDDDLEPWSVGYVGSGGFLAPAFAGDTVATWAPPPEGGAIWLDATQVRELEPRLHPDVVGGWWFKDDASVDARRLTCSLRAACVAAGVQILSGPHNEVSSLDLEDGTCRGVFLKSNKKSRGGKRFIKANQVLIANGAWMRDLLPIPIESHKGQSMSLRMPKGSSSFLRRVLFAQDAYIVPKADGRIILGATVEAGCFDPNVTPIGLMHILTHAMELVPGLKDLPVEETWVGLRPTTPDKGPILGNTPWDNVFVAGGYWRNGVLLAPKTGQLVASLMLSSSGNEAGTKLNEKDAAFLTAFAWDRFTAPERSAALTANARYASSTHPIQKRGQASITAGTELGSYQTARAAGDDRKRERAALLSSDMDDDSAFEKAAALGQKDIGAYNFDKVEVNGATTDVEIDNLDVEPAASNNVVQTEAYDLEGAVDALTVGIAQTEESKEGEKSTPSKDLQSVYEKIQENQSKRDVVLATEEEEPDDRPDPGFRIHHVDAETGEMREVPPYTSPKDFLSMLEAEKKGSGTGTSPRPGAPTSTGGVDDSSDSAAAADSEFDGYQDIQSANSRGSRDDELEAMRNARIKNRLGQEIDHSKIGVYGVDNEENVNNANSKPN